MNSATIDLGIDRFARAESLYAAADELDPADRAGFLKRECEDVELRLYVMSLFEDSSPVEEEIEATIVNAISAAFTGGQIGNDELKGEMIGAYRVVRLLGSGGMGMVYLAERADGQFDQQVAIKVGRHKLVSPQTEERLKSERQILADLDHPNIARLFDGGTMADGVPYIVMEYVDGLPIDVYCDLHRLDVDARLRLFQEICGAVHYAHQNLVIHRDIKAANILVTDDGSPKLLDFGIAKLTDTQGTATDGLTHEGAVIMTPANASPEQLLSQPVTTATDTYALGLLLYRLLAGVPPYEIEGISPTEYARLVCDVEPLRPSQKLRQQISSAARSGATIDRAMVERIAFDRSSTVDRLQRRLRGDIDTIVLHALRKEPERRYGSASALGADIGLHQNSMPIAARSESLMYRAGRFVRRHYVSVSMSMLGVIALIAFSIVVTIQNQRIADERDTAQAVSRMLEDIFKASDPAHARDIDISAAEILASGTEKVASELADQPELRATLTGTIGRVYFGLGQYPQSRELLEEALAIRQATLGDSHRDVAAAQTDLAKLLVRAGEHENARQLLHSALTISVTEHGEGSPQVAQVRFLFAELHRATGNVDAAESHARASIESYASLGSGFWLELAETKNLLARILQLRGDLDGALELKRDAIETLRAADGDDHPFMAYYLQNLGVTLLSMNDFDGADVALAEATEVARRVLGEDHDHMAGVLLDRGRVLHARRDYVQAIRFMREAIDLYVGGHASGHPSVGYAQMVLGLVLLDNADHSEAESTFRSALAIVEDALGAEHQYTASALTGLGAVLNETGRVDEATPLLSRALQIRLKDYAPDHPLVAATRTEYADNLARSGQLDEAESLLRESLTVFEGKPGRQLRRTNDALARLIEYRSTVEKAEGAIN
ncbi:MAG: serine/threonine-protein kinase [Woeseiaceae bacterium]|nr:serine/threonine-protein kinase [Woeseiaceae bacterium]